MKLSSKLCRSLAALGLRHRAERCRVAEGRRERTKLIERVKYTQPVGCLSNGRRLIFAAPVAAPCQWERSFSRRGRWIEIVAFPPLRPEIILPPQFKVCRDNLRRISPTQPNQIARHRHVLLDFFSVVIKILTVFPETAILAKFFAHIDPRIVVYINSNRRRIAASSFLWRGFGCSGSDGGFLNPNAAGMANAAAFSSDFSSANP